MVENLKKFRYRHKVSLQIFKKMEDGNNLFIYMKNDKNKMTVYRLLTIDIFHVCFASK